MEVKMKMPDLSTTEGTEIAILKWFVNVGDPVERGQVILEVETDKAVQEIEAIATGTLDIATGWTPGHGSGGAIHRNHRGIEMTGGKLFPRLSIAPLAEGCVRGRELLHEIKLRGYTGSFSHLERLLAKWRRARGAKVVTLPPAPEPTTAPAPTIAMVPPRRRSRDRVVYLANRRGIAMHQAARIVDGRSGGKGGRSEECVAGFHRHASARYAIPSHSSKQRHSKNSTSGSMMRSNREFTQCSASRARFGKTSTPSETR